MRKFGQLSRDIPAFIAERMDLMARIVRRETQPPEENIDRQPASPKPLRFQDWTPVDFSDPPWGMMSHHQRRPLIPTDKAPEFWIWEYPDGPEHPPQRYSKLKWKKEGEN